MHGVDAGAGDDGPEPVGWETVLPDAENERFPMLLDSRGLDAGNPSGSATSEPGLSGRGSTAKRSGASKPSCDSRPIADTV